MRGINGNVTSYSTRFDMFSGKEFLFDRPPRDAADLLGRGAAVDGGGQRLVPAVRAAVGVGGLARQPRAAARLAELAVRRVARRELAVRRVARGELAVRRVAAERERLLLEVLDGARARGGRRAALVALAQRLVAPQVAPPVARHGLQVLAAHAAAGPQLHGLVRVTESVHFPNTALAFVHSPVGNRSLSLLCFTVRRQLPHASLFIPTAKVTTILAMNFHCNRAAFFNCYILLIH